MKPIGKLTVQASYSTTVSSDIALPDGKTINDISCCHIKWGVLYVSFKDGTSEEFDMGDETDTDFKRPSCVAVYERTDEATIYEEDYASPLGLE